MSIRHEDRLDFWPPARLLLNREAVAGLGLREETVRVLVDVGLPVRVEHYGFALGWSAR